MSGVITRVTVLVEASATQRIFRVAARAGSKRTGLPFRAGFMV